MNCTNAGVNNYLLIESGCDRSGGVHEELFKISQEYAKNSRLTLYLSLKKVGELPDICPDTDRTVLKRIVFMTFPDLDQLIAKLHQLHSWGIVPHLIILDGSGLPSGVPDKVCLMVASLLNLAHYTSRRLSEPCNSVLVLSPIVVSTGLRQLLIDLYYYKTAFCDLDELRKCLNV